MRLSHVISCFVLAVMLSAPVQSARADACVIVGGNGTVQETATAVSSAVTATETTLMYAWDQLSSALHTALTSAIAYIHEMISTMLADTMNANTRLSSNLKTYQEKAVKNLDVTGFSACGLENSSLSSANEKQTVNQQAAAFARAGGNRPNDSSTIAKDLQARCKQGFIDTSSGSKDPENAMYIRLFGSKCPSPAIPSYVGADRNIASLLDPLEYSVPTNLPVQLADGVYQPLPATLTGCTSNDGSTDCSAFAAAYDFCQNVTPASPPAQQGSGQATTADLIAGARRNKMAGLSTATDACYKALSRRLQYPSGSNVPAKDAMGTSMSRHDQQVARCQDDLLNFIITNAQSDACKQFGRSDLQADHDRAYRLGNQNYVNSVISGLSLEGKENMKALAWKAEQDLQLDLREEKMGVITAIGVANGISVPSASPLDRAISPQ